MDTITEEKLRMGDEKSLNKGKPANIECDPKTFTELWNLHYKAVHNVGLLTFKGPEKKEDAIALAHIFCSKRNWRFIQVRPFFTDILSDPQTEEERAKFGITRS